MKFNKEESMNLININHDLQVKMPELLMQADTVEEIEKVKELWDVVTRLQNLIDHNLFGLES